MSESVIDRKTAINTETGEQYTPLPEQETTFAGTVTVTGQRLKKDKPEFYSGNVLSKYRSYTYNFTLAALPSDQINDPKSYQNKKFDFVILKSSGKGSDKFVADSSKGVVVKLRPEEITDSADKSTFNDLGLGKDLVNEFNKNSPGRFDMFINDVEIETLMAFTPGTNATLATGVKFDVFEPYSINGFIQALHVGAVSAGYTSYLGASFVLKMSFIGYPDSKEISDPEIVSNSTRYFLLKFKNIEVELTDKGTSYRCECIPFHEAGFGIANVLTSNVKAEGKKVKEILKNFMTNINEQIKKDAKESRERKDSNLLDEYDIKFADEDFDTEDDKNIFADQEVVELFKQEAVYSFADYGNENEVDDKGRKKASADPNTAKAAAEGDPGSVRLSITKPVIQFNANQRISECIAAVIRDSNWGRDLLKRLGEPGNKLIDARGMVDYFIVDVSLDQKGFDEVLNRPVYKYTFVVAPYKIHFTRIPRFKTVKFDERVLEGILARKYKYFYSGENSD